MRRCQTFADHFQASGHRELKELLLLVFVPTVHVHKLVDQSCDSHKLSLTQAMHNSAALNHCEAIQAKMPNKLNGTSFLKLKGRHDGME